MSRARSPESKSVSLRIANRLLFLVAGLAFAVDGRSQALIPGLGAGGTMRLIQTDLAVLESQQPRRDLPCAIIPAKPELSFDFMFHGGYEVQVPIRELSGDGNELTILFRVVPLDRPDDPSYMVQNVHVPELDESSKKAIRFFGNFTLGEGKYHVDWLMRDQVERFCAMSWDLDTKLNSKDSALRQWVPQSQVQPPRQLFEAEPQVIRAPQDGLPRISIIVNFDPSVPSAVLIDDQVLFGLVATLRRMGHDSRIDPLSITICSFETQQVIYQQEDRSSIDLPALGEALESVDLGTVDLKHLQSNRGPAQFATELIREQLAKETPDALIVLGPRASWENGVSREALESLDEFGKPTFYLSYNAEQQSGVRQDPISSIIKRLRGFEYSIRGPKDLFNAWSDVVSRMVRTKQASEASIPTKAVIR